jgi:DnaJ-class molecular chaperone
VYYEILGVAIDASPDAIRKAYHQLAMQYHPDLNNTPEATERMQQINLAYTQIMSRFDNIG